MQIQVGPFHIDMSLTEFLGGLVLLLAPSPFKLRRKPNNKGESDMDEVQEKAIDQSLVSGDLGPETKYDVSFKEGSLQVSVNYMGKLAGGSVALKIPADAVLDAIKNAIPGKVDDAVIELIKASLKK
jgi:hypothetical protein